MHFLCFTLLLPLTALPQDENSENEQLVSWWNDLAGDSERAYRAIWQFVEHPKATAAFLRQQIQPVKAADSKVLAQLVKDLSSDQFAVRAKATRDLEKLQHLAKEALSKAAKTELPLEVQRRIEVLLRKLIGPPADAETVRAVRAVEILELIANEDAREVLKHWASGAPTAILTEEARDSLTRLGTRPQLAPIPLGQKTDGDGEALPYGALARLGTTRFRPGAGYGSDAFLFTEDNKQLMLFGGQGIRFMDAVSGKSAQQPDKSFGSAGHLGLSREQKLLAVSGYHGSKKESSTVFLDWPSCKEVWRVANGTRMSPKSLGITKSRTVVALLYNGTMREWDPVDRLQRIPKLPKDFQGHQISPDGRWVAGHMKDNSALYLWELQSDKPPRRLTTTRYFSPTLAFSADGNKLALTEWRDCVEVWDVPKGRLLHRLVVPQKRGGIEAFTFSPDGKSLAVFQNYERNTIWDLETGKLRCELTRINHPSGVGRYAVFSHDSKRLAAGGWPGIIVWDANTGAATQQDVGHYSVLESLKFSPQGDLVASAGHDGTIRIWDAATGKQLSILLHDLRAWINDLVFSPDGRRLASTAFDDTIRVWDPRTGKQVLKLAGHGELGGRRWIAFAKGGQELVSWGTDCYLRAWDLKTGKAAAEHRILPEGVPKADAPEDQIPILGGVFTADGKLFGLGNSNGSRTFIDIHSGEQAFRLPTRAEPYAMSPNGKHLAMQLTVTDLEIWDFPSRSMAQVVSTDDGIRSVAWSPDGRSFAVVGERDVTLFETASGKTRLGLENLEGRPYRAAFAPDGRRLAVGLLDTSILIMDLPTIARAH
ncbi:MAG: WD40 repeat domain-containing protein [Planctomycetes bacterium]|nr:WD40 repeat domain-containing protein [Planctomycetota bacterium]